MSDLHHFTIKVPTDELDSSFKKAWDRLSSKFESMGLEAPVYIPLPAPEPVALFGGAVHVPATDIEIFAPVMVAISGWSFVAKLDHLIGGEIAAEPLVKRLGDVSIPDRYIHSGPRCDHCNTNRKRRDTFLLRHVDTGEWIQVGRTCLQDFLISDPTYVLKLYLALEGLQGLDVSLRTDWGQYQGNFRTWTYSRDIFLEAVQMSVESRGWLSSTDARENGGRPTWRHAHELYCGDRFEYEEFDSRGLCDPMVRALEWIESVDPQGSNYLLNLQRICQSEWIDYKDLALATSLYIANFNRLKREKEAKHEVSSEFVGELKQRREFFAQVEMVKPFSSPYGEKYLHKFRDSEGNILTWWGTTEPLCQGQSYHFKGTVKKHDTYRGVKQTILSRVSVIDAPKPVTPKLSQQEWDELMSPGFSREME